MSPLKTLLALSSRSLACGSFLAADGKQSEAEGSRNPHPPGNPRPLRRLRTQAGQGARPDPRPSSAREVLARPPLRASSQSHSSGWPFAMTRAVAQSDLAGRLRCQRAAGLQLLVADPLEQVVEPFGAAQQKQGGQDYIQSGGLRVAQRREQAQVQPECEHQRQAERDRAQDPFLVLADQRLQCGIEELKELLQGAADDYGWGEQDDDLIHVPPPASDAGRDK